MTGFSTRSCVYTLYKNEFWKKHNTIQNSKLYHLGCRTERVPQRWNWQTVWLYVEVIILWDSVTRKRWNFLFSLLISLGDSSNFEAAHSGYSRTQDAFSLSFLSKGRLISWTFLFWSFGVFCVSVPLPQKSVRIRCHIFFHVQRWEFTTSPIVYTLDAASLQACAWLTDCSEITIFPHIHILTTCRPFPITQLCGTCQAILHWTFILAARTCWKSVCSCDVRHSRGFVIMVKNW